MGGENKSRFTLCNETSTPVSADLFARIFEDLYMQTGSLTLVLTTDEVTAALNEGYRGMLYPADILSFPAVVPEGFPEPGTAEIYISVERAVARAREAGNTLEQQLVFLFLHGVLHLLGYTHGGEMERLEDTYATKYE